MRNRTLDLAIPKRKTVLVRQLENELLIYDEKTNKAHCLNQTAAEVFNLCDGKRNVTEIIRALEKESVAPQLVEAALAKLAKAGLLTGLPPLPEMDATRRALVRKLGATAAIALPLVASMIVPTAAQAASCLNLGQICTSNAQCCSGHCGILGLNLVCLV